MCPAMAVGACQIPTGVAGRAPLSHCGGNGITAIAPFADENGRNKPAETAVERRHRNDGRHEPFATTTTTTTATTTTTTTTESSSAAYQDGALRDGCTARRRDRRRCYDADDDGQWRQRYQSARPV